MKHLYLVLLLIGMVCWSLSPTQASDNYSTEKVDISVDIIAEGLKNPWGIEVLPDGALIVTERPGQMRIVNDGKISEPIVGVPEVLAANQGGLLDIALANDFANSGTIYFTYSAEDSDGFGTVLTKAKLVRDGLSARLENVEVLFTMNKKTSQTRHFGSRIAIAEDDTIFFSIGDRADRPRAQDFLDYAGAIIRVNPDGSVPADNPFVGREGVYPELWSKGHRNAQGLDIDEQTGLLYLSEHGAQGGDEVNLSEAGKNYGWPIISYGQHYGGGKIGEGTEADGLEQPLFYWDPSIAPGGMVVYRGEEFPEWDGDFLVTALKFQLLSRLDRDETGKIIGEERILEREYGRMREVIVAPDGTLLILTDDGNGKILQVSRKR